MQPLCHLSLIRNETHSDAEHPEKSFRKITFSISAKGDDAAEVVDNWINEAYDEYKAMLRGKKPEPVRCVPRSCTTCKVVACSEKGLAKGWVVLRGWIVELPYFVEWIVPFFCVQATAFNFGILLCLGDWKSTNYVLVG